MASYEEGHVPWNRGVYSGSYQSRHRQVAKAAGKASGYLCEGCCGSRAREWAQVHGREGGVVPFSDFVPLCKRCHVRYDEVARKVSEKTLGVPHGPHAGYTVSEKVLERGQRWAEEQKALWADPEFKERHRAAVSAGVQAWWDKRRGVERPN